MVRFTIWAVVVFSLCNTANAQVISGHKFSDQAEAPQPDVWETGEFHWVVTPPILSVRAERLPPSKDHPWIAVKDPSIVNFDRRLHLFCTLRKDKQGDGRIRIGYCSFEKWSQARDATWHVLELTDGYHGAPQIFYFKPQKLWYLIYQAEDAKRGLKYGPCYSVNPDITKPADWTRPKPLYTVQPGEKAGLDFWVICDQKKAHLLFTSLDGRMRHSSTSLSEFPDRGWSPRKVVLKADIFEASHTYKLKGRDQYVTLVEAKKGPRRYFKFFLAKNPAGPWKGLADRQTKPGVSIANVDNQSDSWTTSYSHGELLRSSYDQNMEVNPRHLHILFQGAKDQGTKKSQSYGDIRWSLGILKQVEDDN